jgi:hypothetical protein
VVVAKVEDIPLPEKSLGIWIQPEGNQLRVHLDQAAPETYRRCRRRRTRPFIYTRPIMSPWPAFPSRPERRFAWRESL